MNSPPRADCDADINAITIEQAQELIQDRLIPFDENETLATVDAIGRVLSNDVYSPISVPGFRASAMDGYAIRTSDESVSLLISSTSLAGHPGPDRLPDGCCQRITTGARVPDDADAVVQQENTERSDDQITILKSAKPGLNIRLPGSDSKSGECLLQSGTLLQAAQLAVLAAHGIASIQVRRKLNIALFSTGDELNIPPSALATGQIYDANRPLLQALLTNPAIAVTDLGITKDSQAALTHTFEKAKFADIVISSGGVSVGDADHVRQVLEKIGSVDLWKIAMKPGRPLTFGFSNEDQAYFGLPGNPVSAALTTLLFVKPALRYVLGMEKKTYPPMYLPLSCDLHKLPGRVEYQRAIMSEDSQGDWTVGTTGLQDSHVLTSLHKANCLVELAIGSIGAKTGDSVRVIPFTHFSNSEL